MGPKLSGSKEFMDSEIYILNKGKWLSERKGHHCILISIYRIISIEQNEIKDNKLV